MTLSRRHFLTTSAAGTAVFGLGLEVWFLSIGLCLHTQTLNSSHSRFKFNVPVYTFELGRLELFSHNGFGHETIVVFKITCGVFKVDAIWFATCTTTQAKFCIVFVFL
jgi:hypothetical protein